MTVAGESNLSIARSLIEARCGIGLDETALTTLIGKPEKFKTSL